MPVCRPRPAAPPLIALTATLLLAGCVTQQSAASASGQPAAVALASETSRAPASPAMFERDRQSILSMAGDYRVTFDFTETVSFDADYVVKPPKLSGAHEVVRVIEDRGDFISLQHILVAAHDGKTFPIKHWRQDWQYEPERVLVFIGANAWEWRDISEADRKGKWSQTVYQVDDAPRYGAVAAWSYENGAASWSPPHEWRPLPRRDMTTRDDYHAINAMNRHVVTPFGWAHEQDNDKLILSESEPRILAREIGVNTYQRYDDFDVSVATDYWAATEDFWKAIRAEWDEVAGQSGRFGLTIQGETEELYSPLLELAGDLAEGRLTSEEAQAKGRAFLRSFVTFEPGPLQTRVAATPPIGNDS